MCATLDENKDKILNTASLGEHCAFHSVNEEEEL